MNARVQPWPRMWGLFWMFRKGLPPSPVDLLLIRVSSKLQSASDKILNFQYWKNWNVLTSEHSKFLEGVGSLTLKIQIVCAPNFGYVLLSVPFVHTNSVKKGATRNPNLLKWCLFVTAFKSIFMVSSHTKFQINLVIYVSCLILLYWENKVNFTKKGV